MEREVLEGVKETIKNQVGKKVKVKVNRGRHRIDISSGIIKEVYPSLFIVELDKEDDEVRPKRLSFSYIDVVTHEVQMMLVD